MEKRVTFVINTYISKYRYVFSHYIIKTNKNYKTIYGKFQLFRFKTTQDVFRNTSEKAKLWLLTVAIIELLSKKGWIICGEQRIEHLNISQLNINVNIFGTISSKSREHEDDKK